MENLNNFLKSLSSKGHIVKVDNYPSPHGIIKTGNVSLKQGISEKAVSDLVRMFLGIPGVKDAYWTGDAKRWYVGFDAVVPEFTESGESEGKGKMKGSVSKDFEAEMRKPTDRMQIKKDLVSPGGIGLFSTNYRQVEDVNESSMGDLAIEIGEWQEMGMSEKEILDKLKSQYSMSAQEAKELYDDFKGSKKKEVYGLVNGHSPVLNKSYPYGEGKNVKKLKQTCKECGFKLYECGCLNESLSNSQKERLKNFYRQAVAVWSARYNQPIHARPAAEKILEIMQPSLSDSSEWEHDNGEIERYVNYLSDLDRKTAWSHKVSAPWLSKNKVKESIDTEIKRIKTLIKPGLKIEAGDGSIAEIKTLTGDSFTYSYIKGGEKDKGIKGNINRLVQAIIEKDLEIVESKVGNGQKSGEGDIMGKKPHWMRGTGVIGKNEPISKEEFKIRMENLKKKEIVPKGDAINEIEPELEELKRKVIAGEMKCKGEGDEEGVEQFKKWGDDLATMEDELKSLKSEGVIKKGDVLDFGDEQKVKIVEIYKDDAYLKDIGKKPVLGLSLDRFMVKDLEKWLAKGKFKIVSESTDLTIGVDRDVAETVMKMIRKVRPAKEAISYLLSKGLSQSDASSMYDALSNMVSRMALAGAGTAEGASSDSYERFSLQDKNNIMKARQELAKNNIAFQFSMIGNLGYFNFHGQAAKNFDFAMKVVEKVIDASKEPSPVPEWKIQTFNESKSGVAGEGRRQYGEPVTIVGNPGAEGKGKTDDPYDTAYHKVIGSVGGMNTTVVQDLLMQLKGVTNLEQAMKIYYRFIAEKGVPKNSKTAAGLAKLLDVLIDLSVVTEMKQGRSPTKCIRKNKQAIMEADAMAVHPTLHIDLKRFSGDVGALWNAIRNQLSAEGYLTFASEIWETVKNEKSWDGFLSRLREFITIK